MSETYDPAGAWRRLYALAQGPRKGMPEPLSIPMCAPDVEPYLENLARSVEAREQAQRAVVDLVGVPEMQCEHQLAELHHRLGEEPLGLDRVKELLHVVGHWVAYVAAERAGVHEAWLEYTTPTTRRESGAMTREAVARQLRATPKREDAEIVSAVAESCGISKRAARMALSEVRRDAATRKLKASPDASDMPDLGPESKPSQGS